MYEPITVVIPTYARAEILTGCLAGLRAQTRSPDRIVAVVRPSDISTREMLAGYPEVDIVDVHEPGFIPALNAGAAAVTSGIMVYTDDDAVARPSWLERIEEHFRRDPALSGVGGRDVINGIEVPPEQRKYRVGRTVWGRPIGNHHLGAGPPRYVDVLKGVNAAYRREHLPTVPFDHRLRGNGGHHNEMGLGNRLKTDGRQLLYDPDILVDHYPAPRIDGWRHGGIEVGGNEAFNEQLAFTSRPSLDRLLALMWGLALGTPTAPGLVRLLKDSTVYEQPLQWLARMTKARMAGASTRPAG